MEICKKQTIAFKGNNVIAWKSDYIKPTGRFWKRFYNKKVRNLKNYLDFKF